MISHTSLEMCPQDDDDIYSYVTISLAQSTFEALDVVEIALFPCLPSGNEN